MPEKSDFQKSRVIALKTKANETMSQAEEAQEKARAATRGIPMEQPILVGHHSQRGHEKALTTSHKAMDKALDLAEKSKAYKQKAKTAGKIISSDDPDAKLLLLSLIAGLENTREIARRINRLVTAEVRRLGGKSQIDDFSVVVESIHKEIAQICPKGLENLQMLVHVFSFRQPMLNLAGMSAEIKRLQARVATIDARDDRKIFAASCAIGELEFPGGYGVENFKANRVQLFFDAPPDPDSKYKRKLKVNGWRWSPRSKCWQRQNTENGVQALTNFVDSANSV